MKVCSILSVLLTLQGSARPCEIGCHHFDPAESDVNSPLTVQTPAPIGDRSDPLSAPSKSPAPSTVAAPSNALSTASSTAPSAAPSTAPSTSPSDKPSTGGCEVHEEGVFGDIVGDQTLIEYGYELEVKSGANVVSQVLPSVERAVVNSILPEFFPVECGSGRRLHISRRLEIVGISESPDDIIIDVSCTAVDGNECYVISGGLYVFSSTGSDVTLQEESIHQSIKDDMDDGVFDNVQEDIVRVTYVELAPITNPGTGQVNADVDPNVAAPQNGVRIGLSVTAAVVLVAVLAVAYRRKQYPNADENTELGAETLTL